MNFDAISNMCLPDINLQRPTNDSNLAVGEWLLLTLGMVKVAAVVEGL